MKASEILLESPMFDNITRRQTLRMLTDLVFAHYGANAERISNGDTVDAILILFDQLMEDDPIQKMALVDSMAELFYKVAQ